MATTAILALEDGTVFKGVSIGADGSSTAEVVFNTSMTGYQEILTDPSYARQMVTLTYPHIGNTGVNSEDEESSNVWCEGLIIRDLPLISSSWRSEESLDAYLKRKGVVGIADIDTRKPTRILREKGAQAFFAPVSHAQADQFSGPLLGSPRSYNTQENSGDYRHRQSPTQAANHRSSWDHRPQSPGEKGPE